MMVDKVALLLLVGLALQSPVCLAVDLALPDPFCSPPMYLKPTHQLKDAKGVKVPTPLLDRRKNGVIPSKFPTSVFEAEGGTYSWLYLQIFNLLGWAPCPLVPSSSATAYPTPVGWTLVEVLRSTASFGGKQQPIPMAAVLKPDAKNTRGKQLVVVIRGTAFKNESAINDDYTLVSDPAYGAGLIHRGYRSVANQLWGNSEQGLLSVLEQLVVNGGDDKVQHIVFSGHSLGGAVGTLLATRTQKYLETACAGEGKCSFLKYEGSPVVSLVTFASTNTGNTRYVVHFRRRINARTIDFAADRVQQWLLTRWPNDIKPLKPPTYKRVPGALGFAGPDMPFQDSVWSKVAAPGTAEEANALITIRMGLSQKTETLYTAAAHLCSYMCYTSQFVSNLTNNWCLLHEDKEGLVGSKASYCSHFPPYALVDVYPTRTLYP